MKAGIWDQALPYNLISIHKINFINQSYSAFKLIDFIYMHPVLDNIQTKDAFYIEQYLLRSFPRDLATISQNIDELRFVIQ